MREREVARSVDVGGLAEQTVRSTTPPVVRWIKARDVVDALQQGIADFRAIPTHGLLFGVVYAVAGLVLARAAQQAALLPLIFPLVSGFALVGPVLALGLYELSRRREQGLETRWWHVFGVRRHVSTRAVLALGAMLALLLITWLATADWLFQTIIGSRPADATDFLQVMFSTDAGWTLIIVGHAVGFVFAVVAFLLSAVSLPLLVDRDVGLWAAIATSIQAVLANPLPMALWAAIIALGLIIGSAPLLLGLPVVLPVLGHTTWHIYRRVILP